MKYDPEYTRKFYNAYEGNEWARLDHNAYGRLQAIIHDDFVRRYVGSGHRVLDAGSGPGRFSITAAECGATVSVLDISDTQLEIARQKIDEAGKSDSIERYIRGDIADLSVFPDDTFDTTICFGGPLSYVCEKRFAAVDELVRVTKPGGAILVSVMSLNGSALSLVTIPVVPLLEKPDEEVHGNPPLWPILETGDLPGFPSGRGGMDHAPMHLYRATELQDLFKNCTVLETAGSNVTMHEHTKSGDIIAENPKAWETLVELEKKLNHDPGMVNCGSHIIMAVRK